MTKIATGGHPDLKMVNPAAAAIDIGSTMHSHKNCRDCAGDHAAVIVMLSSNRVRFLVSTQHIDFRKGHEGLAALV